MTRVSQLLGHKTRGRIMGLENLDILDAARLMCLPSMGRNKVKLGTIADKVGLAESTLYGILNGNGPLLAAHVPALRWASNDTLLPEVLALKCGMLALPLPTPKVGTRPDQVMVELANVIREHADIPQTVLQMIDPESPGGQSATFSELKELDLKIMKLVSALVGLRGVIAETLDDP